MGVIQRQGIKTTIVNYAGTVIGALAVLFVYTSNDEINGYATWLFSTASLLVPIASWGLLALIVRYFPQFSKDNEDTYNGFLKIILSGLLLSFSVFLLIWFLAKDTIFKYLSKLGSQDINFYEENHIYLIILVGLFVFLRFLTNQSSNKLRIVVPNLVQQFGYKVFLPSFILIYAAFDLTKDQFAQGYLLFFGLCALVLFIYLNKIGGFKWGKIRKPSSLKSYKEMLSFSAYSVFNALGNSMLLRLDAAMIPIFMSDMSNNSFYIKAYFFANVIEMPTRSLNQIAAPIISKAWASNNLSEISNIYKKASSNLFAIGVFVFIGIWYSIDDLVNISSDPNTFPFIKTIFLLIGATKLIDMLTSVNTHIIGLSKHYRFNFYALLFLAVSNLLMNAHFIPLHGIKGAAFATAISLIMYNVLKLLFIIIKFGLHPFTTSNLKVLSLGLVLFVLSYYWPIDINPLVNMIIKSVFVALIYLPIAYLWNVSEEINKLVLQGIEIISKPFKK